MSRKVTLDEKDIKILNILQYNCRLSAKEIAQEIGSPTTTVYAKIKRMEKLGIIRGYSALINPRAIGKGATAFILASFAYSNPKLETLLSQREVAKEISSFPEVQEVHIISGDWDLLIKVRAEDVETIGRFVIDKLRTVKGIEKTLTCMVFDSTKETLNVDIPNVKELIVRQGKSRK